MAQDDSTIVVQTHHIDAGGNLTRGPCIYTLDEQTQETLKELCENHGVSRAGTPSVSNMITKLRTIQLESTTTAWKKRCCGALGVKSVSRKTASDLIQYITTDISNNLDVNQPNREEQPASTLTASPATLEDYSDFMIISSPEFRKQNLSVYETSNNFFSQDYQYLKTLESKLESVQQQLDSKNNELRTQIVSRNKLFSHAVQDLRIAQETISRLHTEKEESQQRIAHLTQELRDLRDSSRLQSDENGLLVSQLDEAQCIAQKYRAEFEETREHCRCLANELSQRQADVTHLDTSVREQSETVEKLNRELEDMTQRYVYSEGRLQSIEAQRLPSMGHLTEDLAAILECDEAQERLGGATNMRSKTILERRADRRVQQGEYLRYANRCETLPNRVLESPIPSDGLTPFVAGAGAQNQAPSIRNGVEVLSRLHRQPNEGARNFHINTGPFQYSSLTSNTIRTLTELESGSPHSGRSLVLPLSTGRACVDVMELLGLLSVDMSRLFAPLINQADKDISTSIQRLVEIQAELFGRQSFLTNLLSLVQQYWKVVQDEQDYIESNIYHIWHSGHQKTKSEANTQAQLLAELHRLATARASISSDRTFIGHGARFANGKVRI